MFTKTLASFANVFISHKKVILNYAFSFAQQLALDYCYRNK